MSKGVLDVLKSVYLGFRKVKVQRVTVVKLGMYSRSGNGINRVIPALRYFESRLTFNCVLLYT